MKEVIGQVLRLLRKEAGLSQEALADRAGITKNYLSELERGKKLPSYITLSKMAHSLNMRHWQLTKRIEEQIQHYGTNSAIAKISPKEAEPDWNQNFFAIHEQGRVKARLRISKVLEQSTAKRRKPKSLKVRQCQDSSAKKRVFQQKPYNVP